MIDLILLGAALGFLGLLIILERIGSWLGLRRRPPLESQGDEKRLGHVLGSIFGLLALLMGFTFSMAVERFERRNRDLVAEANAIGTAHDRLALLGTAKARALQSDLRDYARLRLRLGSSEGPDEHEEILAISSHERQKLKAEAIRAAEPVALSALANGVMSTMDQVADVGVQRDAGLNARLPRAVFMVLVSFICVAVAMTGYAFPASGSRRWAGLFLSGLLVATLFLIIDRDRPFGGSIVINQ